MGDCLFEEILRCCGEIRHILLTGTQAIKCTGGHTGYREGGPQVCRQTYIDKLVKAVVE